MSWLVQLLEKNSSDPRLRLELGDQIIAELSRHRLPCDAKSLNELCDVTYQWLAASNFKVSLLALEILHSSLETSGDVLAPYVLERIPPLLERLGDSKSQVRDAVTGLLLELASVPLCSAQIVLEKISPGFCHKQWLVRCGTMNLYRMLLEESREELEIQTHRLVPTLCKLMADPNVEVREVATNTIVHVMVQLGEGIATSIRNGRLIPDNKLQMLLQRYDSAIRTGCVPSAMPRPVRTPRKSSLEGHSSATPPRAMSASVNHRTASSSNSTSMSFKHPLMRNDPSDQENRAVRSVSNLSSRGLSAMKKPEVRQPISPTGGLPPLPPQSRSRRSSAAGVAAGAVTEDAFRASFSAVPKIEIHSARDVRSKMEDQRVILSDESIDWGKRTNALKVVRSIVINGGLDFDEDLLSALLTMEEAFVISVRDLRSQVCKEACTTLCFLSERIPSPTRLARLFEVILPIAIALTQNSAKVMATSGVQACEFIIRNVQSPKLIAVVLENVSHKSKEIRRKTQELVQQVMLGWDHTRLKEATMLAMINAIRVGVCDADISARTAARTSFGHLETMYPEKAANLKASLDLKTQKALSGGASAASSSQSISSVRDTTPMNRRPGPGLLPRHNANSFLSGRSASAIDSSSPSIRRAPINSRVASSGYGAPPKASPRPNVIRSGSGLTTTPAQSRPPVAPLKKSSTINSSACTSQPGSRSTSPSRMAKGALPSSSRTGQQIPARSSGYGQTPVRNGHSTGSNGNGQELLRAINNLSMNVEDDDEDFLGFGMPTNYRAAASAPAPAPPLPLGSPMRLEKGDLLGAVQRCLSDQVADKKEGLKNIHDIVSSGRRLSEADAKKVADALQKLLQEGNHRLLSSLMDTISVLIQTHSELLGHWLPQLMGRMLIRSAGEILPASQNLLASGLAAIRTAFDTQLQLTVICKFIQDPIQTPSIKVKGAALVYLHELLQSLQSGCDLSEMGSTLNKMFHWMQDPKNQTIVPKCDTVICDLFASNSAAFSLLVQQLSSQCKDYAFEVLKKNGNRAAAASSSSSSTMMSSQHHQAPPHSVASPARSIPATPPHQKANNVNYGSMLGPLASQNNGERRDHHEVQMMDVGREPAQLLESSSNDDEAPMDLDNTMHLLDDSAEQRDYVQKLLKDLAASRDGSHYFEQRKALNHLHQMIAEGSLTLWDEFFKPILLNSLDMLSVDSRNDYIRRDALKLLQKMCMAQAARFNEYADMALAKTINVHSQTNLLFARNAMDECLLTLAAHLPLPVVIRVVKNVICDIEDERAPTCFKMIQSLATSLPSSDVQTMIPEIAPLVVQCYKSSKIPVRKGTVFVLAAMMNSVGNEALMPYMGPDNFPVTALRLVEVYRGRLQTASTSF